MRLGIRRIISLSFISLGLFVFLVGCGGGTRGTGGIEFAGKVLAPNAAPLSQVSVSLVGTQESTVTDTNGAFTIRTSVQGEPLFSLTSANGEVRIAVTGIPAEASRVQLTLEADFQRKRGRVTEVTVERRRGEDRDDDDSDDDDSDDNGSDDDGSDDDGSDDGVDDDRDDDDQPDSDEDDDSGDLPDDDQSDDDSGDDSQDDGV